MTDLAGTVSPTGVVHLADGRRRFAAGHTASVKHGAGSPRLIAPVAEDIEAALEVMVAGTPAAAPSFAAARGALALKLARLARVREWIDDKADGLPIGGDGKPIPAAALERELLASVEASLSALGLTPMAASKLGVRIAQGESLVERMQREARGTGGVR